MKYLTLLAVLSVALLSSAAPCAEHNSNSNSNSDIRVNHEKNNSFQDNSNREQNINHENNSNHENNVSIKKNTEINESNRFEDNSHHKEKINTQTVVVEGEKSSGGGLLGLNAINLLSPQTKTTTIYQTAKNDSA